MEDDFRQEWIETNRQLNLQMREWKDEMVSIVSTYSGDISSLRRAQEEAEAQKLKPWYVHRKMIGWGIFALLFFVGFLLFINKAKICGTVKIPVFYSGTPFEYTSTQGCNK